MGLVLSLRVVSGMSWQLAAWRMDRLRGEHYMSRWVACRSTWTLSKAGVSVRCSLFAIHCSNLLELLLAFPLSVLLVMPPSLLVPCVRCSLKVC